ncbi:MAG: elongation factor P [Candidatus Saccharimonadales bacterium]
MYSISDLRKGMVIELEGEPYKVIDAQHKSLGRGGAVLNAKVKNLQDGSVISKTFKGNDKIEPATVDLVDMQFLYKDAAGLVLMNTESYEQATIPLDLVENEAMFIKEGETIIVEYFRTKPIGIKLPPKVELKVDKTTPAVKGDTAKAAQKNATLETGLVLRVPLFIEEGNKIRVDTKTGEYAERA